MANLFTAIKIESLENLKDIDSKLNELEFNTHFVNNYSKMWTKNGTAVNYAYLYLSFCALKGKTDYGKLFSYPITKIKKLSGYFPQTIGMDGNQIIKVGEKILRYDKKDLDLTRKIEFELSCEGANKDFIPHILEEQEIWDYYKLG